MNIRKLIFYLLIGLLALAIAYQGVSVIQEYALPFLKAAWRTRDLSGMEKSALFLLGSEGAEYVTFLDEMVPEDYQIVTPNGVANHLRDQSVLQFFSLPRDIPSCPCGKPLTEEKNERCLECLRVPNNAVLVMGDYPPGDETELDKVFIPFPGESDYFHGLYMDQPGNKAAPVSENGYRTPFLAAGLLDISLMIVLFLTGGLLVTLIVKSPSWFDVLSLGVPLGAGLSTLSVFLLGWLGIPVRLEVVLTAISILLLGLIILNYVRYQTLRPNRILGAFKNELAGLRSPLNLVLSAILLLLVVILIVVSLTRAYSLYDGIANWALKGYAIAEFNTIFAGRDWGGHGLSYPQNIHLLVAFFRLLDGDILPGSKFVFPVYALSLIIGCFAFWRRHAVSHWLSLLGGLLIITIPFIFYHSSIGWSNVIFSVYIVLGSLLVIDGGMTRDESRVLLGGVVLSFAGWTRVEGGGFALLMLSVIMIALAITRSWKPEYLLSFIPVILVAGLWVLFGARYLAGDEVGRVLQSVMDAVQDGQMNLSPLGPILVFAGEAFRKTGTWGLLAYILPILLVFGLFSITRRKMRTAIPLLVAAITALVIPIGMFYFATFDGSHSSLFLSVSFDRAMIPAIVLAIVFCITIASVGPIHSNQLTD